MFRNVTFAYPDKKEHKVIKSFNCRFDAGKTTVLVGPSGSGKSTIFKLIERFHNIDEGSITLN